MPLVSRENRTSALASGKKRGPGRVFMDISQKHKGIRDTFVNISRDTGYLDQF